MKLRTLFPLALLLMSSLCSAQYYLVAIDGTVAGLPAPQGAPVIQLSFPLSWGMWDPAMTGNDPPKDDANSAYIITKKGQPSMFTLNSSTGICSSGCSYQGTFLTYNGKPQIESVLMPDGSVLTRVSGTLVGRFTWGAQSRDGITARLYFETYPKWASETQNGWVNALGVAIVELAAD